MTPARAGHAHSAATPIQPPRTRRVTACRRRVTATPPCDRRVPAPARCGHFYLALKEFSAAELQRIRTTRIAQLGAIHRALALAFFLLVAAPVVAKYLCHLQGHSYGGSNTDDICSS